MIAPISRRDCALIAKHEHITRALDRFRSETRPDLSRYSCEIRQLLTYIHEHVFEPGVNVSSVKAICRLRNNNITTRFRQALGIGLREYIEQLRLEAAALLLRNATLEVYLVAAAVGYDHQETFCRAFYRHFGRTPSESRCGMSLERIAG